ncbi:hypothetical protein SRHO_G00304530 [Serrasalmus rhombeus]
MEIRPSVVSSCSVAAGDWTLGAALALRTLFGCWSAVLMKGPVPDTQQVFSVWDRARELDLSRAELSPGALRTAPCVQLQWQFTHVATLLAVAGNGEMQPSLIGEHHQRKHAALLQARAPVAAWFTLRLK